MGMTALVTVTRRKPGVPSQNLVADKQLPGWIGRGRGGGTWEEKLVCAKTKARMGYHRRERDL